MPLPRRSASSRPWTCASSRWAAASAPSRCAWSCSRTNGCSSLPRSGWSTTGSRDSSTTSAPLRLFRARLHCAGFQDLAGAEYAQWYPIWRSIEGRPERWREPPGAPEWRAWLRFTETPIPDRQADALRQLFWLDFPGWNATISAHAWPFRYLAPNLDLNVQFHRFAPEQEWILADGVVPLARDGLVGCVSRLWTESGELLATGSSNHVCRRNPVYAEELARAREMGLAPPGD